MAKQDSVVEVEGRHLKLSNLDKVLYPEAGFTKGQVIDYYVRVAPALLPHLHERPLTMKRYPNGVGGMFFYEKNCPKHRPEWVKTTRVWSEGNNRWMDYCLIEDLATLVWAGNLADLELHTSLSLGKEILRPTFIVFDLDPGPPANIVQCCRVGLWVREIFAKLGLESFAKTSGSKGLQIYVPLNVAVTYDDTKPFAHELARTLERQHPELVVSDMKKALRTGKVLVDWSQNDDHKTTVCVYSLRAKERPTVSTPVSWQEVETCLKNGDPNLLVFEAAQVLDRVKRDGDLFEPVLKLKQKLPAIESLQEIQGTPVETKPSPRKPKSSAPKVQHEKVTAPTVHTGTKRSTNKKTDVARKRG
jgi:bifunctional non-homologous end joining protein LigD